MSIQNRDLEAGVVLVGTYRKESYRCRIEKEDDGMVFVLEDGRRFRSASAAAGAVMGGKSVNGWLFWSLATAEVEPAAPEPKKEKKGFKRVANQKGLAGGTTRYWCDGCMKSFVTEGEPETCPAGHNAEGVS